MRIATLAGEQVDIQANRKGGLERGHHNLWPFTRPEARNLLSQYCPLSIQPMQLLPHTVQLMLQLLQQRHRTPPLVPSWRLGVGGPMLVGNPPALGLVVSSSHGR
jgi:hypothetical protein